MDQQIPITYGSHSDLGLIRTENQDSSRKVPEDSLDLNHPRGILFIMADGMGGHAGGKTASGMAIHKIGDFFSSEESDNTREVLSHALQNANHDIYQRAHETPELYGMGTTCTALLLKKDCAYIAHVGDSRAYRINRENIWQLTQDHSHVAEMQRLGILSEKEAKNHPERSVLTRALGTAPKVKVDIIENLPIRNDEYFLLCTDGLAKISDKELKEIVLTNQPQKASEKLVELANKRGGHDNATVQIIKINSHQINSNSPNISIKNVLKKIGIILLLGILSTATWFYLFKDASLQPSTSPNLDSVQESFPADSDSPPLDVLNTDSLPGTITDPTLSK